MIVVMKAHASEAELQAVMARVEALGYRPHVIRGVERNVVGCVGDEPGKHQLQQLESFAGVESVMPVLKPFKLASREVRPEGSIIKVNGVEIGGPRIAVIAGPCAVAGAGGGCGGQGRRSASASRRSLQAAHLSVFVPGYGR